MTQLLRSMGNCLSPRSNIIRVVRTDGKILEYRDPILVKDLLMNYSECSVSPSQEASPPLPPDYELKIGKTYYLSPCSSSNADGKEKGGVKRIKVVITKQQLQELLSNKVSVEEVILGFQKGRWEEGEGEGVYESPRSWKPKLETIPEGSE